MKVTKVSTRIVEVPEKDDFLWSGQAVARSWPVATIRIGTDAGLEGIGFAFSHGGLTRSLHTVLVELGDLLTGADPTRIELLLAKLRQAGGAARDGTLFMMAQAAIDAALWDLRGKASGLPLWRLAGGARDTVPAYASGQLARELADGQATDMAKRLVEAGFRKIKFHLSLPGDFSVGQEVDRARLLRRAVGDGIEIGCDVNGRWRPDQALQVCGRLRDVGLSWIEDPIAFDDIDGMAQLSAQFSTPFMAGESNNSLTSFRLLLEKRAVSIVMIDFMMVGGITNWLKIAGMAEAFNIPVVSHLVPEVQAHLVAGVRNGLMAEHKSWIWNLFEETPAFAHGGFVLPERPGLGLSFDKRIYGDGW